MYILTQLTLTAFIPTLQLRKLRHIRAVICRSARQPGAKLFTGEISLAPPCITEAASLMSSSLFFFFFLINLFYLFYFWLHWVFVAVRRLSLVVANRGYSSCGARASHCSGFSSCGAQALGTQASVVVVRGLSSCGSRALECTLSSCGARA